MSSNLDVMGASDEDLLKAASPVAPPVVTPPAEEPPAPAAPVETPEPQQEEPAAEEPDETTEPTPEPAPQAEPEPEKKPEEPEPEPEAPKKEPVKTEAPAEDVAKYKAFYDQVMAPIKAGGKTIQLTSPEEAISLMQKGLDYTRKTQEVSKYRKFGMMLENNGLLDPEKLDHLIAVYNKDPEALKKFLKDNKIDPVDIDTSTEDKYKPGAHAVSDQQAKLQEAIDDLKASDGGQETLESVSAWDKASKQVLWDSPQLLSAIHAQRKSGVYAKITAEVDRRKALGQVPNETPFLQSYKMVGDELLAQGKLGDGTNVAPKAPAAAGGGPRVPVARRPASPPAGTTPGKSAARAAAATRTTPKSVTAVPNFMAMSDEEVAKL